MTPSTLLLSGSFQFSLVPCSFSLLPLLFDLTFWQKSRRSGIDPKKQREIPISRCSLPFFLHLPSTCNSWILLDIFHSLFFPFVRACVIFLFFWHRNSDSARFVLSLNLCCLHSWPTLSRKGEESHKNLSSFPRSLKQRTVSSIIGFFPILWNCLWLRTTIFIFLKNNQRRKYFHSFFLSWFPPNKARSKVVHFYGRYWPKGHRRRIQGFAKANWWWRWKWPSRWLHFPFLLFLPFFLHVLVTEKTNVGQNVVLGPFMQ